jgi:hypothetical protein
MSTPRWPVELQRPYQHSQLREGTAITTKPFPLDWMLLLVRPAIFLDGYQLPPGGWGRSVVAAPPGQHHVHVHVPYFLPQRLGPADAIVDAPPGHVVELEYKAPAWGFSPGSLGAGRQPHNGLGVLIAVAVITATVAILLFVVAVFA